MNVTQHAMKILYQQQPEMKETKQKVYRFF